MTDYKIKKIVIAGGGTAGWIAAAALSKQLGQYLEITLVESEQIGTVGVGEATIPTIRSFHQALEIDEQAFMRATQATFKVAIQFNGWGSEQSSYLHTFGTTGQSAWLYDFQQYWLHAKAKGFAGNFGDYSFEHEAAVNNKFAIVNKPQLSYAYHLDATLYAKFLRSFCEKLGVKRIEGKIKEVKKNKDNGNIRTLNMENGHSIEGDFFIDCTGFKALLIGQSLNTTYDDWSDHLLCDRALAVQTSLVKEPPPYTQSTAHRSGWQWKIPLQHRVGNGLVYSSRYMSDDEALATFKSNLEGEMLFEPRTVKFQTGKRRKSWVKNCVALGLSSGFLEPLESTSIHLIMSNIIRLIQMFPATENYQAQMNEYNTQCDNELLDIRDFIIMHYHLNQREESDFWSYCHAMEIPESLAHRIQLFRDSGLVVKRDSDLFRIDSWLQVMMGQGVMPTRYHPISNTWNDEDLSNFLKKMNTAVINGISRLSSHQEFIDAYCKSSTYTK